MCLEIYIILQINQFIGTDSCHIHAKKRGNDYMTGLFLKVKLHLLISWTVKVFYKTPPDMLRLVTQSNKTSKL